MSVSTTRSSAPGGAVADRSQPVMIKAMVISAVWMSGSVVMFGKLAVTVLLSSFTLSVAITIVRCICNRYVTSRASTLARGDDGGGVEDDNEL